MNSIKLIKSFAGYPVWEYKLEADNRYYNELKHNYIHKDIVEGMPQYFEEVKYEDRISKVYNELWNIYVYYSLEKFREVIEKHIPSK